MRQTGLLEVGKTSSLGPAHCAGKDSFTLRVFLVVAGFNNLTQLFALAHDTFLHQGQQVGLLLLAPID